MCQALELCLARSELTILLLTSFLMTEETQKADEGKFV